MPRALSRLSRRARLGTSAALSMLLWEIAEPAWAQGADAGDKATAEVLFDQGKALLLQGKFNEACPKLAESLRLDTGIGTMLYLAECYERSGKTASAWAEFREAQASAAKESDPREKVAKERADKLEPTLSRLTVVVPPDADVLGLVLLRDGTAIGRAGWGIEVPVDPGSHVIRATAPGRDAQESTVDVGKEGARARFVVPVLATSPVIAPPAGARAPVDPPPDRRAGSSQRTIGISVAAAGIVGLGVATFFGVKALGTLDDSEAHCNERACDQDGLDLRDRSRTQANVSTIVFVVAGAAVAGGAVLWITAPTSRGVAVAPVLGPSTGGLAAVGRF
jgi:hypothetical protein